MGVDEKNGSLPAGANGLPVSRGGAAGSAYLTSSLLLLLPQPGSQPC